MSSAGETNGLDKDSEPNNQTNGHVMEDKQEIGAVTKEKSENGHTNGHANGTTAVDMKENGDPDKSASTEEGKDEEKKKEGEEDIGPMVGVLEVFRYASGLDILMMILGGIGAAAHGIAFPCMIIVFGDMLDSFLNVDTACELCANATGLIEAFNNQSRSGVTAFECDFMFSQNKEHQNSLKLFSEYVENVTANLNNTGVIEEEFSQEDLLNDMQLYAIYYAAIGAGVMLVSYLQVAFWSLPAKRQARRIRMLFFKACLRQNIGWFDTNPAGELSTRLADDIDKIENGIGDKIATLIQLAAQTITCVAIGFVYGWLLTLIILATSPLIAITAGIMDWVGQSTTVQEQGAYAEAGGVADEVLSAIRTVIAFGGQSKECDRYNANLGKAKKFAVKKGAVSGVAMGFVMFIVGLSYALGFWAGSRIVLGAELTLPHLHEDFTVGNMLIVFFSILIASFSFGQAAPAIKDLAIARGAAHFVFDLIERVPEIDIESEEGAKPDNVTGKIEFKDVHFQYPSRPDVKVLQGLNFEVETGKTVALVGSSGCGKSTTVQLIQRFYDAAEGSVTLDGKDVKDLNLRWLRSQIGIVSQEPILFATTIAENIRYGRDDVTDAEMEQAAREANAHSFIEKLPDRYETLVGARGAQLSGGQKQRIAIARALVNSPKVLLLDEATSALDTESEKTVQDALEKASHGRTTIVIAHRLTTIQNADTIIAFDQGQAVERGTHSELMAKDGIYAALVKKQTKKQSKQAEAGDDSSDDEEEELEKEKALALAAQKKEEVIKRVASPTAAVDEETINVVSKDKEAQKEEVESVGFLELLSWNRQEWYYIMFGCIGSIINGGSQPAFAVAFSKILAGFMSCEDDVMEERANFYSLIFVAIAFAMFFAHTLEGVMFSLSGEALTERVRKEAFKTYLRQDVHYFDDPANSTGALTTRLSVEAAAIKGATGPRLGALFNALANIGTAIIIAFLHSWVLTLAILAFAPFMAVAGFIEQKVFRGAGGGKNKDLFEEAGKIASESISNIRTVQGLGKEKLFYQKYENVFEAPYKKEVRMTQGVGATYGVSQGIVFFAYAALFYLGAWLVIPSQPGETPKPEKLTFESMMITFSVIAFGAMSLGEASSFAPNYEKGVEAAAHIKKLRNAKPDIDSYSEDGEKPDRYAASIEFKDTVFHYPTRPSVRVLEHLTVDVQPGQTLALVGSSGCGKSTTVQLIERFYDVEEGSVTIGSHDVKALNVAWLRTQVGLVSQEPVLFDRSIAENIKYGANHREVSMAEVIEAATKANIHSFISELPDGYETSVGDKGTQLSGGQKQRIAIARALVRNPTILLLDEATSALDSESEHIVQEALDNASKGRTTVVIAHRLSTVRNADKIAVIRHGHVSEQGTHDELMALKGFYYKLINIQTLQE